MAEKTEVLIVGAGPGGLACATVLAQGGVRVTVIERKPGIGPKVCAGGITWSGLIRHVPRSLIEREFPVQHIITPRQQLAVAETDPIIATINRQRLGQWMADQARSAGARIITACQAVSLGGNQATLLEKNSRRQTIAFDHLVGADGSNSLVRRYLGLPVARMGLGLNCMIRERYPKMEWHLHTGFFGSGYGWIFPHQDTTSIGAYCNARQMPATVLKQRLLTWASGRRLALDPAAIRAGLVNYDYRGIRFANQTWLIGDAAGLASGLTGEGIYPAIVSGQTVAKMIIDPAHPGTGLQPLIKKHRLHSRVVALAGSNIRLCTLFMEMMAGLLRLKVLDFHALEMAD